MYEDRESVHREGRSRKMFTLTAPTLAAAADGPERTGRSYDEPGEGRSA